LRDFLDILHAIFFLNKIEINKYLRQVSLSHTIN